MRKVGALILLGLSVGACGVGDEDYTPPDTDDRNEELGIVCEGVFNLTGTFVAGTPGRPADVSGCWPVGTWTFTASLAESTCPAGPDGTAAAIAVLPSYRFTVGRVEGNDMQGYVDTYSWAGDISAVRRLKVTAGGGGECEGGLELFSADGTQFWNMKPNQTGGVLSGTGEYALYNENAR